MTYIPNTREKYRKSRFSQEKSENPYWQGYLNQKDAMWVSGYDGCADVIDNAFDNLLAYEDIFLQAGFNPEKVNYSILDDERLVNSYTEEELANMSPETRLLKCMREHIRGWVEMVRDEYITGCLDSMSEEEYEGIVQNVKNGTYKNVVVQAENM